MSGSGEEEEDFSILQKSVIPNLLEEVFQPTFLTEIEDSESDKKCQNDLWRTTERCYGHTDVNPCEDVTVQETTNIDLHKETSEENSVEKRKIFRSNVDYRKTLGDLKHSIVINIHTGYQKRPRKFSL